MCASTAARTCSRAASSETWASVTAGNCSVGRASIRSIWAICLATGACDSTRRSLIPSRNVSRYCSMATGKLPKRESRRWRPSGVSAIWYCATWMGMVPTPEMWSIASW